MEAESDRRLVSETGSATVAGMKPQVVVVGSFVQDLTFACPTFPAPGETTLGKFVTGPGGKGSNQAVACARAGVTTRFIGAVGRDGFAAGAKAFQEAWDAPDWMNLSDMAQGAIPHVVDLRAALADLDR